MKKTFLLLFIQSYFSFGQQQNYAVDTSFHFKPKTVLSELFNRTDYTEGVKYLGSYQSNHIISSDQDLYLLDTAGNVVMSYLNDNVEARDLQFSLPDGYRNESGFWFIKYYSLINTKYPDIKHIMVLLFFDNKTKKVTQQLLLGNQYNQISNLAIRGDDFYLIRPDGQKFWIYDLKSNRLVKDFELYPQLFSNSSNADLNYKIQDVYRINSSEFMVLCSTYSENREKVHLFRAKNEDIPRPANKVFEVELVGNNNNVGRFLDDKNLMISNQDSSYSANCFLVNYNTVNVSNKTRVSKTFEDKAMFLDNRWVVFDQNSHIETRLF